MVFKCWPITVPNYLQHNYFRDERKHFFLNAKINTQNCRYESDNSELVLWSHTVFWKNISVNKYFGWSHHWSHFFEGFSNGLTYLWMLQDNISSQINNVVAQNPCHFWLDVTFQHDDAPPHYFRETRNDLDVTYPDIWIGRRGLTKWPPGSLDLMSVDFFYQIM